MDLVVTRGNIALRIDQERAVGRPVVGNLDRQRADVNKNAKSAREFAQSRERGVRLFIDDYREKLLTSGGQNVRHFGRQYIGGTRTFRFPDEPHSVVEVGGWLEARAHLNHGGLKGAGAHRDASPPANSRSSLPARSSACSSLLPPTCNAPMKICGTVICPLAR